MDRFPILTIVRWLLLGAAVLSILVGLIALGDDDYGPTTFVLALFSAISFVATSEGIKLALFVEDHLYHIRFSLIPTSQPTSSLGSRLASGQPSPVISTPEPESRLPASAHLRDVHLAFGDSLVTATGVLKPDEPLKLVYTINTNYPVDVSAEFRGPDGSRYNVANSKQSRGQVGVLSQPLPENQASWPTGAWTAQLFVDSVPELTLPFSVSDLTTLAATVTGERAVILKIPGHRTSAAGVAINGKQVTLVGRDSDCQWVQLGESNAWGWIDVSKLAVDGDIMTLPITYFPQQ